MALVWVTNPGNKFPDDPDFNKSVEEQQRIFAAIDKESDLSCCRICGSIHNLSKEHTPSKAAFNRDSFISLSIFHPLTKFLQWRVKKVQGGRKDKTLCKTCNNNSGGWYNPEYVKLARLCAPFARQKNAQNAVNIETSLYPSRLIKQALTNICSVSQPGLCKKYTHLREFIMERSKIGDLSPLKVGLFIPAVKTGRSSGVIIFVDTKLKIARLIAEFSFWPLGWILTFDNLPYSGTLDVTSWSSVRIDEKIDLSLSVPCQWCASPYPGDFRSPEVIAKSIPESGIKKEP